jgi:lysyl-tRNA synthetase class 2
MAELRKVRMSKIQAMNSEGVTPYAYSYSVTSTAASLKEKYVNLGNGCEDVDSTFSIAGRVMKRRFFGKLAFFEMQDHSGNIQLYIDKKKLGPDFKKLKDWTDSGDIIGVTGTLKRTEKGELSVFVTDWRMLTKALHPLPDKFHGLTDIKKRYAHRSVDMIVNPEVRRTLILRAVIIKSLRRWVPGCQSPCMLAPCVIFPH